MYIIDELISHNFFVALMYKDELEKKALADEDIENVSCPEEGFHNESTEKNENDDDYISSHDKESILPEKIKFLRETIKHCRHFISMIAVPQWQLLSMEIVGVSILGLQMEQ